MSVKRIVGALEERSRSVITSSSPARPAAKPKARFIAHPLLRRRDSSSEDDGTGCAIDGLPDTIPSLPAPGQDGPNSTTDAPEPPSPCATDDRSPRQTAIPGPSMTSREGCSSTPREQSLFRIAKLKQTPDEHELQDLSPRTAPSDSRTRSERSLTNFTVDNDLSSYDDSGFASSTTLVQRGRRERLVSTHTPIPATTVFARSAAPLALPDLDNYIASLPGPSFPSFPEAKQASSGGLFPPLDRLEASGKTLDDLEHNAQVPHWWQNRNKLFGAFTTLSLAITGSSAVATLYSLHGLIDTVQIFALLLNTIEHKSTDSGNQWREIFLGTIPNVLALNLVSSIRVALILLLVFMALAAVLLYFFYRATSLCCQLGTPEGLQQPSYMQNSWSLLLIAFLLTAIYLPLSTMAVHILVWSDDLWVVPNPYVYPNGTAISSTPDLTPLGPPERFREPLDFCWTTTMERNSINYAPAVIIIAIACILGFTLWFPYHLHKAIAIVCPKVDRYTELGARRSNNDMDQEYERLLDRDRNPLQFLYHDYRRGWATYEAIILFAKFLALMIVAVIDPNNCVFRSLPRTHVEVARQIILLCVMLGFFLAQCVVAPSTDPVGNASEFTSWLNYVLTSLIALLVALKVGGQASLNGWVLYTVYGVTYGLSVYFTVINWSLTQRWVKKISRRIDFSIDIFSPRIDLSPSSRHLKRRIWQETISALFLTDPGCGIPKTQTMQFVEARDAAEYPPYLLAFAGTPGERHVENLKIFREMGSVAYDQAVALTSGSDSERFRQLREAIQGSFVGPDCYWKSPDEQATAGCTRSFGNAWFIPFPPTVVLKYDDGPRVVLSTMTELELYVGQNSSHDIQRRREVRMALRALDGQVVLWPYEHIQPVGARSPLCCCLPGRRFSAQTTYHYRAAIFKLKRNGLLPFEGLNLGSGFDVQLTYARRVVVDGSVIGLTEDYDLTPPLARFLALNEELVPGPLTYVEDVLSRYRHALKAESARKEEALSYRFLSFVYNRPRDPRGLAQSSIEHEHDPRVRRLMLGSEDVLKIAYERLSVVSTSPLATWWYIFWDDMWRRNHDTIDGLKKYPSDFNPHYPSCIAYRPLPRAALESFLAQRGMLHKKVEWDDAFHAGLLNKMYLRMNDIVFHGTNRADIIHVGENTTEHDMEEIDAETQARPSTLGTGNGTDEDDVSIRARPLFRWEGIFYDRLRGHQPHHKRWLAKLGVWFGLTSRWRAGVPSAGLALDVRLVNGQYVLLQSELDEADETQEKE